VLAGLISSAIPTAQASETCFWCSAAHRGRSSGLSSLQASPELPCVWHLLTQPGVVFTFFCFSLPVRSNPSTQGLMTWQWDVTSSPTAPPLSWFELASWLTKGESPGTLLTDVNPVTRCQVVWLVVSVCFNILAGRQVASSVSKEKVEEQTSLCDSKLGLEQDSVGA